MATQYISMSNTMRVYRHLVDLRAQGYLYVSRADVARQLSDNMCRATCYWAFEVLCDAGVLMHSTTSEVFKGDTGRPPRLYTLYWPFAPSSLTVAELRVENHYIREGRNGAK